MAMLEVKDLEVYYGMIQAIKGISFEVNHTSYNYRSSSVKERNCNI